MDVAHPIHPFDTFSETKTPLVTLIPRVPMSLDSAHGTEPKLDCLSPPPLPSTPARSMDPGVPGTPGYLGHLSTEYYYCPWCHVLRPILSTTRLYALSNTLSYTWQRSISPLASPPNSHQQPSTRELTLEPMQPFDGPALRVPRVASIPLPLPSPAVAIGPVP